MGRGYEADLVRIGSFLSKNKNGLVALMEREAAGAARQSAQLKRTTTWLQRYDVTSAFLKENRSGLLALVDREAAGAARSAPATRSVTSWVKYHGLKWYFAYLF